MVKVHLLPLEVRGIRIDLYRDRLTEAVRRCAVGNCGYAGRGAFPDHYHAVGLGRQQIGPVFKCSIAAARRETDRYHSCDHDDCQQKAEQALTAFLHFFVTPYPILSLSQHTLLAAVIFGIKFTVIRSPLLFSRVLTACATNDYIFIIR